MTATTPSQATRRIPGESGTWVFLFGDMFVFGAFFVGLLLGVVESLGGSYINPGYQDMFGFVFLVIILVVRPEGLFHRGMAKE